MSLSNAKIFFEDFIKAPILDFSPLAQSGSSRVNYIGNSDKGSFIITYNKNVRENEAFFYLSDKFSELKLNTPKILAINKDRTLYIQEFLGRKTLSEIISEDGHTASTKYLAQKSIEKLFELQQKTKGHIDFSKTFEYEAYDNLPITHDLYYFKNFLIDILEIPYHKGSLLKEFRQLALKIEKFSPKVLMLRDFQARNIIVNEENVFFIDYQSSMEGPAIYDVVSFLFQAKANFPAQWKEEMLEYYISLWDKNAQNQLWETFPYCQLIRFLQVLGAYGLRGIIQKKPHFISSLNQGIENIHRFFEHWEEKNNYPELYNIISLLYHNKQNLTH